MAVRKKAIFVAMRYQLGTRLRIGVRVKAIQFLIFPVSPGPLLIEINLVGCHVQEGFDAAAVANAFQNVYRTHDVGLVGVGRVFVAVTDNRLSCQMQHNFRLCLIERSLQSFVIPNVANHRMNVVFDSGNFKQRWRRGRIQRITRHDCSGVGQHFTQPGALETSVSSNKYPFPVVET